jgi:hypothetical protein
MKDEKSIEVDGWRVYDLPIQYSETDYEEARTEITKQAQNTSGLVALFEFGLIPALGISDMDFWAVFEDSAERMCLSTVPNLSEKISYLMDHEILVIAEKHYRKMLYFDSWTTYAWPNGHRLLYQKENIKRDLNFEKIEFSNEERNILSATRIDECLGTVYSNIPYFAKKELPVRQIFETIKDCVYIIEEINIVTDRKIDPIFSENFRDLRANWFKLEQNEAVRRLIEIFYQGLLIGFEASFSLASWIDKYSHPESIDSLRIKKANSSNRQPLGDGASYVYLNTPKDRRVFTDGLKTPAQALELSINSYRKLKVNVGWRSRLIDYYMVYQPLGMASMLLGFSDNAGLLSDNLKKDIYTNQEEVKVFRPEIFREKIKMINEITDIYNKKQDEAGGGKGWLFGNNRFGYSFNHEKIRRKILTSLLKRKYWQIINGKI